MGAWGALQAQRVSNPSAPSGRSEKGVAEQGTPLSCTPFPSSCSPHIPIRGRCLPGGCCSDSCATCWEARREAGAQQPVHFCQGGLSLLHKKETVCFIQARKIPVLLPDIVETLQDANSDVKMKALVFLRNMMGHTKREEASLIALQLAEKLLPLFDDVRLPWEPQSADGHSAKTAALQPSPVGSTWAGLPSSLLLCGLSGLWGHSATAADPAHSSYVQDPTPEHLPSHQPR